VDPKGDPQEPLREAASNRRFRGRFCFCKTGAQVKYFTGRRPDRCWNASRNTYQFSRYLTGLHLPIHSP